MLSTTSRLKGCGGVRRSKLFRCGSVNIIRSVRSGTHLDTMLCDENRERVVAHLQQYRRSLLQSSEEEDGDREFGSAILLPFCSLDGEPALIFTRRSPNLLSHRNDFSFPGGKVDEQLDGGSYTHTAVRECCEEIGTSPDRIDVWGEIRRPSKYVRRRYLTIPVIANLGSVEALNLHYLHPSPEVAEVHVVKVRELVDGRRQTWTIFKMVRPREDADKYTSPIYTVPSQLTSRPVRLWGMCASMTSLVLPMLLPGFSHACRAPTFPHFFK